MFSRLVSAICWVLVLLPASVWPQEAGKTGLAFLKTGVGARAAALGESHVALADDPTAIYWNPAGLAQIRGTHLAFTHLSWLESIRHDFAAVTFPGFGGVLGLALTRQTIPDIELRSSPTPEPLGSFDARSLAASLSFGRHWHPRLSLGVTVKYLYEKLYLNSSSGVAADIGARWETPLARLCAAAAVHNLGAMSAMLDEKIKLPSLVRLGVAYTFTGSDGTPWLTVVGEQLHFLNGGGNPSAGLEVTPKEGVALRGGYQFGREHRGLATGLGVRVGRYDLDYGYAAFDSDMGQVHRFSIGIGL